MLIVRLRLPSSFPLGFAGWWAVGVTVLPNHCWNTGVCVSVVCGVRVGLCDCLVYSTLTCLCAGLWCQFVGNGCGHTPLLFFHWSKLAVNKCSYYFQEHSGVSLSLFIVNNIWLIINSCLPVASLSLWASVVLQSGDMLGKIISEFGVWFWVKGAICKIDSPPVVAFLYQLYTKTNLHVSHTSPGTPPAPPPVLSRSLLRRGQRLTSG